MREERDGSACVRKARLDRLARASNSAAEGAEAEQKTGLASERSDSKADSSLRGRRGGGREEREREEKKKRERERKNREGEDKRASYGICCFLSGSHVTRERQSKREREKGTATNPASEQSTQ